MENIGYVAESLELLQRKISLDVKSTELCVSLIQDYVEQLECKKDIGPVIPPELRAVIELVQKVNTDLLITGDVVSENVKLLRNTDAKYSAQK